LTSIQATKGRLGVDHSGRGEGKEGPKGSEIVFELGKDRLLALVFREKGRA